MNVELKNKIALIAGASQGIGYATALAFAREGAQETFDLTLMSTVRLSRAVIPTMQKQHWGRIIHLCSAQLLDVAAKNEQLSLEEAIAKRQSPIPLGRLGEPEEIALPIVFLSSAGANFITGATITIDGRESRFPF